MIENGNPALWAETGGLTGLVIFALFLALALFIRSISNIYNMHREDMRLLLDLHQRERDDWWKVVDARQRESNAAIHAMSEALNKLSARYRKNDQYDD